ncbi:type VI secretion system baseplate subunit TssG [Aliiruegeria sabulilitoris]|uniref:type VI secretion system baseplate subunit TssG n=1 Tax=Aliiruegeria sabulilitoris TaxID=1510458 RepID=UPI0008325317|nr:type VI secretion system baseplate subunit TssG [Aliiruegeria sabulilitoris]NDR59042.1 type VI secretion system baseplate subunit TssG [Pseudoruegeria sp. M32A2M]
MASSDGPRPDHLNWFAGLQERPGDYHIYLAMRLLDAARGGKRGLGATHRPVEDKMRFGQEPSLSFPPTTLTKFRPGEGEDPSVLINRFFGFFGPSGPLPLHLTEFARDRLVNERDPTFVAFADMLTHRPATLLFRAWKTGQPAADFDRGPGGPVEVAVAALSRLHGSALRDRDAMPDLAKRHFAGHLAPGPRTPEALVSMLSLFFGTNAHIEEFIGSWLELEPEDTWQLGAPAGLGQATAIGSRVWTRSAKFRLTLGPLSREAYERLLPGSESLRRLAAIVRNHVGDTLDWDVNLVLRAEDVPPAKLGADTQLGLTSWIGDRAEMGDADDLFVSPERDIRPAA